MGLPKALLFDLDGTLLDNSEVVIEAYYTGMEKFGYNAKNREFIRTILGKSTYATGRELGLKEEDLPKIDSHFWDYFGSFAENPEYIPKIFPGVKEVLEFSRMKKIPTGIVTSNKAKFAQNLMKKVNLDKFITIYIGVEHVKEKKPSPEPLLKAIECLGISKKNGKDANVWYIGDTPSDIESAKNAGILSIGIPEEGKISMVKEREPDYLFLSMYELLKFLKNKS